MPTLHYAKERTNENDQTQHDFQNEILSVGGSVSADLRYKVWVVGSHTDKGPLRISGRIEYFVEFGQRRRDLGSLSENGGDYDEEVDE